MKYKCEITPSALKSLKEQFKEFNEKTFTLLYEKQTKEKKKGKNYTELVCWINKSSKEFAVYYFDAFVNAKGYFTPDHLYERKYFKTLNDMYLWVKTDHDDEKVKMFEKAEKYCIELTEINLKENIPEKNHKEKLKSHKI